MIYTGTSIILLAVAHVAFFPATATATTSPTATTYCSCQYNVPYEAEAECRSYGQLGDDVLIPWYRANQTCLDAYEIRAVAIDRDVLLSICPYDNATDVDIQLLLNEIRYNPSPATRAIQASYPLFWIESNDTSSVGSYELVDVIYDGRNNPNCVTSETLCYNTIREYFTLHPEELGTACQEFHARHRFDLDLEQSTLRIRLCQEVTAVTLNIPSDCEPLVSQLREIQNQNPSKACSAFGLGPGTQVQLPTRSNSDCVGSSNTLNATTSSSSSSMTIGSYPHPFLLVGLLAIALTRFYF